MTVQELTQLLAQYPSGLRVVVNGYEGGYDDLAAGRISVVKISLNTGTHDWDGKHGPADRLPEEVAPDAEIVEALVFHRASFL